MYKKFYNKLLLQCVKLQALEATIVLVTLELRLQGLGTQYKQ